MFERGGVKIAVLGQAFAYTPIANPRWMMPNWSFGCRRGHAHAMSRRHARNGAQLVVLLSHNGFDVDRKLAGRVPGIDVDPHRAYARRAARGGHRRPHFWSRPAVTASSCRGSISMCRAAPSRIIASS